jgi:hypothetical protein
MIRIDDIQLRDVSPTPWRAEPDHINGRYWRLYDAGNYPIARIYRPERDGSLIVHAWTMARVIAAVARGEHLSATQAQDMCKAWGIKTITGIGGTPV